MKTASARKRWWWLAVPAGILALFLIASLLLVRASTRSLKVGSHAYHLQVAQTEAAQEKGLGDRDSLQKIKACYLSLADQATRCFWMKDMRFPLDIIWLDSTKTVVHIQPDVVPSTYPETFCPSELAQYVIELNAGQAKRAGITAGQTLSF